MTMYFDLKNICKLKEFIKNYETKEPQNFNLIQMIENLRKEEEKKELKNEQTRKRRKQTNRRKK